VAKSIRPLAFTLALLALAGAALLPLARVSNGHPVPVR
jgi:hypothetical protein